MHSDRKIGFAMGILLVGVVAALFFRHEPDPLPVAEQLSHPRRQQLNQRLKDREIAVFIPEERPQSGNHESNPTEPRWTLHSVFDELDQKNRPAPAPLPRPRSDDFHMANRSSLDGYRTWRPDKAAEKPTASDPSPADPQRPTPDNKPAIRATAPAPKRPLPPLHSSPPAIAALRSPEADQQLPPESPSIPADFPADFPPARSTSDPPPETQQNFREHTVQFGDTLSSIAQQYLGSQAHYRKIFEANRDQLSSPDQLKIGSRLRIPLP